MIKSVRLDGMCFLLKLGATNTWESRFVAGGLPYYNSVPQWRGRFCQVGECMWNQTCDYAYASSILLSDSFWIHRSPNFLEPNTVYLGSTLSWTSKREAQRRVSNVFAFAKTTIDVWNARSLYCSKSSGDVGQNMIVPSYGTKGQVKSEDRIQRNAWKTSRIFVSRFLPGTCSGLASCATTVVNCFVMCLDYVSPVPKVPGQICSRGAGVVFLRPQPQRALSREVLAW